MQLAKQQRKDVKTAQITNCLEIKKGDKIAIIGAGGKTSLAKSLALENKALKTILTTSTKMYNDFDDNFNNLIDKEILLENGVNIVGKSIANKFYLDDKNLLKNADLIIYEADGAKKKPFKGYKDDEPVFLKDTNKCVGVIAYSYLNKNINESFIHRFSLFQKQFSHKIISNDFIKELIKLIFRDFKGIKYIYLKECKDLNLAKNLADSLNDFKVFASFNNSYTRINY